MIAVMMALGVDAGGVVRGPVTAEEVRQATELASRLELHGYPEAAKTMRGYAQQGAKLVPQPAPAAPAVSPRSATTEAPRSAAPAKRPPRVSVDQATIKISAVDRELAMALHRRQAQKLAPAPRQGAMAAVRQWFVRLFGGGSSSAERTPPRDDTRDR